MTTARLQLPQADRLSLMVALLEAVSRGVEGIVPFSQALSVTTRQVHYYAHAAAFLGLIEGEEGKFSLTKDGRQVLDFDPDRRFEAIVGLALAHPNLAELLLPLSDEAEIDTKVIARAIEGSGYGTATAERRAQTIVGWFRQAGLDLSQSLRAGCPVRDQLSIFDATMLAAKPQEEERPDDTPKPNKEPKTQPQEPVASFENITLPSPDQAAEIIVPAAPTLSKKKPLKTRRTKAEETSTLEERTIDLNTEPTVDPTPLALEQIVRPILTVDTDQPTEALATSPEQDLVKTLSTQQEPQPTPAPQEMVQVAERPVPSNDDQALQQETNPALNEPPLFKEVELLQTVNQEHPEEPPALLPEPTRAAPIRQLTLVPAVPKLAHLPGSSKAPTTEVTSIARGESALRKNEPAKQPIEPEPSNQRVEPRPPSREPEISSLRAVLEHLEDEDDVFGLRASQETRERSRRKGPVFVGVALRASLEPGRATIVCRLGLGSKPAAVFREVSTTKQIVQCLLEDGIAVIAVAAPLWLPGEDPGRPGSIEEELASLEKEDPDLWVARPWTRSPFVGALGFARVELEGSSPGLAARGRCLREALAQQNIFPRMTPATLDDPGPRIIEVHPGLTLAALANAASKDTEKLPPGRRLRRAVEEEAGPVDIPLDADGRHRDALAAAWTALKFSKGAAWSPEGSSLQAGFVVVPFLG
jgi:hypothetical protein